MKNYFQNPIPHIPRTVKEGADYEPNWRQRAVEWYCLKIEQADDPNQALAEILSKEHDEFVFHFLLFQLDGPCLMRDAIRYAAGCSRSNPKTGLASKIKAMAVADFLEEEIAMELGTEPFNISAFEYIYFDVRQNLRHQGWLRAFCFRGGETDELRAESRLLQLAYMRGQRGIREAFLNQFAAPDATRWPTSFTRLAQAAVERGSEYYLNLDMRGVPPNLGDLQILSTVAHIGKLLESPVFEQTAAPKTPPSAESPEVRLARWEKNVDWDVVICLSASIVKDMAARVDKAALTLIADAAKAEPNADDNSAGVLTAPGPKKISWRNVYEELNKRGFPACEQWPTKWD